MSVLRTNQLALALAESDDAAAVLSAAGQTDAAAAVRGGRPLGEVLSAHRLVPKIYRATFEAGGHVAIRALVDAAARHEARFERSRKVARAALASATSAWIVMILASTWAVPAFLAQFVDCGQSLPGIVQWGLTLFGVLASPAGMMCAAAAVIGLWFGARALWVRAPAGRRCEDAYCATALAALVEGGVSVPEAMRRVASATHRSARFMAAAHTLENGAPMHTALQQAGIIGPSQAGLVDGAGSALPGVLRAIAAIREADEAAREPHAGQWIWVVYALIVGSVAAIFAGLIIGGSVTVMQCVG